MMKMSTSVSASDPEWKMKLFGEKLIKCMTSGEDKEFPLVSTERALGDNIVVEEPNDQIYGVYFSFANINAECDDFTKNLVDFYKKRNDAAGKQKFEVIQVVLWTHTDVIVDYEATFRSNVLDLPWFAVPFSDVDTKRRLAQKYRIKVGAPALVLVKCGGVEISRPSRDTLEDYEGFPWTPRPLEQILAGVPLEKCGRWDEVEGAATEEGGKKAEAPSTYADLPDDCVRAFYFAAHWCPPCKAFTPQLAETYSLIRRRGHDFQVIFVSSDRSQESYSRVVDGMPWLSIGWNQSAVRKELAGALAVQGIPALRLITNKGAVSVEARHHVAGDPDGLNFPWKPGPINILTERYLAKLQEQPAIILFIDGEDSELHFAESVLYPAAESYYEDYSILHPGFYPYLNSPDEETIDFEYTFSSACDRIHSNGTANRKNKYLQFLIAIDTDSSDMLRDHIGLDDAVPLLTAIDFPKNRLAIMQYGAEITTDSVQNFLDNYLSGQLEFQPLRPFTEDNLRDSCD